jgi:N-acetyl-anhydromuramyl-L-alanine amidase AmpD
MLKIVDHRAQRDGAPVAFERTPNTSRALAPQGIIVHDTAGHLHGDDAISWLCNPAAKASAHFVVKRDGSITQLAPCNVQTWHAGKSTWLGRSNVNGFAVGIEIVNPGKLDKAGDDYVNDLKVKVPGHMDVQPASTKAHGSGYWLAYSAEQVQAVTELCQALRAAYPAIGWVATHWEISPGRKIDTNPLFPLERLRRAVFGDGASAPEARAPEPVKAPPGAPPPAKPPAKPAPQKPANGIADWEVRGLQQRLRDLAITEVGAVDGIWGSRTTGGVAAFQAWQGIAVTGKLDEATRSRLSDPDLAPRPVSPERAATTVEDLRERGSTTIKAAQTGRGLSWLFALLGIGGGAQQVGLVDGAQSVLNEAGAIRPVVEGARDLAGWIASAWWIAALVGAYLVWHYFGEIIQRRLADQISGRHM